MLEFFSPNGYNEKVKCRYDAKTTPHSVHSLRHPQPPSRHPEFISGSKKKTVKKAKEQEV